jgi:pyruvate dehydrogenase E2 component (dihydrolipoamide acetyltransferase)
MFPIGPDARRRIADRILDRSRDGIRSKLSTLMFDPGLVTDHLVEEEWRINDSQGATESFEALAHYFKERLDDDVVGDQLLDALGDQGRMVIWGAVDKSVPVEIGQKTAALLRTSLLAIPKTAHAPYWEAPSVFDQAVTGFLLQSTRARATS